MRLDLSERGGRLGTDATNHDFLAREKWDEFDIRILFKMLIKMLSGTAGESVKK